MNLGVIFNKCVGGIDLFQWKQGNTWYKLILKRSLSEGSFFWELLEILNSEYKNLYMLSSKIINFSLQISNLIR